ncbi:hypothetical protein [Wohlfahrtiimonas larvae]|uniref:Uncharacterized protein n=1 Tax=Wohlfahrtiimonas larvae TaxID=1157986 RepID=A0ABP9MNB9_9GAMM|nr:hypothetical protein [Wohlfahrtiimonas larvae]
MKKIKFALFIMILSLNIVIAKEFVKNDWFVDEVMHPVQSITVITDTGVMKTLSLTKYDRNGFKESTIITLKYGDIITHKRIFVYFQPYQGNQRTVVTSFSELNQQELLKSWRNIDTALEKWTSHLSYEVIDKMTSSQKILDNYGHMQELSRLFVSDPQNNIYFTKFIYFDSWEDYQLATLDDDMTAIITLAHDEKGNWIYRKSMNDKEQAIVKRYIRYYDNVN